MTRTLLSPSWYRVAETKPRLRRHAQIHRQRFRGQLWHIVQDHQTGRFHRVSPAAYLLICLMSGQRTMQDIWETVGNRMGDDPPTQDETIQLLSQLYNSDLLRGEIAPDMIEMARRAQKQKTQNLFLRIRNPMALRFPLFDPDRFLDATMPIFRLVFTKIGFLIWLAVVFAGISIAALEWPVLTANATDRILAAQNVIMILIAYPLIKALHEMGHAYAAKIWGGEVHEMGIMLLILMPIPYVDASSSLAFREKWRRAVVGGAGIMVELFLAGLAAIVWYLVEPGLVRAFAFNVMLIGGVSTLLFNGNPLLRFDGYYVLCDLLEMPNLGSRSNKYILELIRKYVLRIDEHRAKSDTRGEKIWLVFYGLSAFVYRIFVMLAIALFIAGELFFIGVLLALFAVYSMFLSPVFKGFRFLATSPKIRYRQRAFAIVGGFIALVLGLLVLVPVPYGTIVQGVVWLPENSLVRAETDGTIDKILSPPNEQVTTGGALFSLSDPIIKARVSLYEAELQEYQLRLDAVKVLDLVQADILREQIRHTKAGLSLDLERLEKLTVRSPNEGIFIVRDVKNLRGRFVKNGNLMAYVVGKSDPIVRVVVPQDEVDLVRSRTKKVELRFADNLHDVVAGYILREAPAALDNLPSQALSTSGGGDVAVDSANPNNYRALESLFQIDIGVENEFPSQFIGGRVYVRFDHGREAVAWRVMRSLRQLFLSRFNV